MCKTQKKVSNFVLGVVFTACQLYFSFFHGSPPGNPSQSTWNYLIPHTLVNMEQPIYLNARAMVTTTCCWFNPPININQDAATKKKKKCRRGRRAKERRSTHRGLGKSRWRERQRERETENEFLPSGRPEKRRKLEETLSTDTFKDTLQPNTYITPNIQRKDQ